MIPPEDERFGVRSLLDRAAGGTSPPPISTIHAAVRRRRTLAVAGVTTSLILVGAVALVAAQRDSDSETVVANDPSDASDDEGPLTSATSSPDTESATTETSAEVTSTSESAASPTTVPESTTTMPGSTIDVDLGVFDDNSRPTTGFERRRYRLAGSRHVEGGCVWAIPSQDDPDQRPIPLEWPNGTVARFSVEDDTFDLLQAGQTVAADGQEVELEIMNWPPPAIRCQSISDRAPLRVFGTARR